MKFYRIFVLALLACISLAGLSGCTKVEEPDNRDLVYGYVQFKLYKEASYPEMRCRKDKGHSEI